MKKLLTSLSRTRFEDLRRGILNGSLAQKWGELEGKKSTDLTRKQAVELRQILWLVGIAEGNPAALIAITLDKEWREIRVYDLGNGTIETVTCKRRKRT